MRTFGFTCLLTLFVLSGCATHYHRIQDDRLHVYMKKSGAKEVLFVSSVDRFQPRRAERTTSNAWAVSLPYTSEFKYFYIVDGTVWLPGCRFREKDDFGSENCLFFEGR